MFLDIFQSNFDIILESFNEDRLCYNWIQSMVDSVYELLVIDIKILDNGGFHFLKLDWFTKSLKIQGWRILIGF